MLITALGMCYSRRDIGWQVQANHLAYEGGLDSRVNAEKKKIDSCVAVFKVINRADLIIFFCFEFSVSTDKLSCRPYGWCIKTLHNENEYE